jgi:hypothetical protein
LQLDKWRGKFDFVKTKGVAGLCSLQAVVTIIYILIEWPSSFGHWQKRKCIIKVQGRETICVLFNACELYLKSIHHLCAK